VSGEDKGEIAITIFGQLKEKGGGLRMNHLSQNILDQATKIFRELEDISLKDRIETINKLKILLHQYSPFNSEPVDCVLWIENSQIQANDYNPNSVAPPEMKLLEHSIYEDGYTQPIVTWVNNGYYEVVDGFHRNRVGKESPQVCRRVLGYLPITIINKDREGRNNRIAATIRHNRARGKHRIDGMAEIVIELKRRNWSDEKIGKELGMDPDEILRLSQITGLAEMFADQEFSQAWEACTTEIINEGDDLKDEESLP
jgi:ParB-like chromosome segregation protein Spo0J